MGHLSVKLTAYFTFNISHKHGVNYIVNILKHKQNYIINVLQKVLKLG